MIKIVATTLLLTVHVVGYAAPEIHLTNTINSCVEVETTAPYVLQNKTYIDADFKILQNLGNCACKTLSGVLVLYNAERKEVHFQSLLLRQSHREKIYLGGQISRATRGLYEARLSCMGPA